MTCLRSLLLPPRFPVHVALLALLAAGISLTPAHAQSTDTVTIEAAATPSVVGTGEMVTFTVRVAGATLADVETPEPPPTTGLALQRPTPATQRDISFSDGRLRRSVSFHWTYRPVRSGTARIDPATVSVAGTTYTTDTIRVEVVSQAQRTPPPNASTGSAQQQRTPRATPPRASLLTDRDLFIRAEPEARSVRQNEQVTVTYHLYFRSGVQLRHSRLANAWDATGFWREELAVDSRPIPRSVTIQGQSYQTIVLKRVALFPTRTGSLRVDPLEIETEARVTSRLRGRINPYYSPPDAYESVLLASDSLLIRAAPLPNGAPDSFDGAVGDFELRTSVHPTEVQVGQPIRLRVRIEGTGNIATLQPPVVNASDAFEVYDPEEEASINRDGTHVRGTKTFTYVLVPRSSGTFTLSPTTFTYFDPETNRYRSLHAASASVHVTGDDATAAAVGRTGTGLPLNDVANLMTANEASWVRAQSPPLYRSPWPYVAVLAPLLAAAGGLVAARRRSAMRDDATARTHDGASLTEAQRCLHHQQPEACYDALERAVLGFIGTRLNVAAAGLTRAQLDAHLARHDVPEPAREALYELLDVCDQARYSPAQPTKKAMQSAIRRAEQLIDVLDAQLA